MPFKNQSKRIADLIAKGGDSFFDLEGRCQQTTYDVSKADKVCMKTLGGGQILIK